MDTQKNNAAQASLPDRLRQLIQEKGKPLRDIAAETDFSIASLSAWQSGKKVPQADSILLLCKYFNVSADYLLGLSDVRKVDANIKAVVDYTGLTEKAVEELQELSHFDKELWGIDDKPANYSLSMLLESGTMLEIILDIYKYYFSGDCAKKQRERIISTLREQKSKGRLYEYLLELTIFYDSFFPEDFDESEESDLYQEAKNFIDSKSFDELCDFVIADENEGYDDKRDVAELHAQKAITRFFDKMQATIEQGTSNETEFFTEMSKDFYPERTPYITRAFEATVEASENIKAGVDNGTTTEKTK